jgi:hypothetical protein
MALQDYEKLDGDDFHGQGFAQDGVVSIWIGIGDPKGLDPKIDVLQDLCGVGHYDLDNQEIVIKDKVTPLADLVAAVSYAESFSKAVARAPRAQDVRGRWLVAQFDFKYTPKRVKRTIAREPRFLGAFPYKADD